jgi:hypothetical protein
VIGVMRKTYTLATCVARPMRGDLPELATLPLESMLKGRMSVTFGSQDEMR